MQNNVTSDPLTLTSPTHFQSEDYRQLIENLPVAIYTCDSEGYIHFFNKAAVELWGRKPHIRQDRWFGCPKIYQPDGKQIAPDNSPMAVGLRERKKVRGVEIIMERPDGSRVQVLPHIDVMIDSEGQMIGGVNMLVDMTAHQQTKEDNLLLQQYNSQLEQFAYAASHDMQEPLRKIHTFSELLDKCYGDQLNEQGKTYLNKIKLSANRMHSLIQDLLDYSRHTKLSAQAVPTDLKMVLRNIETDLEVLINSKEARIETDSLPVINAIPSQMNRLLCNLLHNALKFARPDVPPLIKISVVPGVWINDKNYFEIVIADNGIGFEQKYADRIFNLFQRLNDRHSYDGNGIGLALCKKIMENHDGQIEVQSEPGAGTSFHLRFPAELIVDSL